VVARVYHSKQELSRNFIVSPLTTIIYNGRLRSIIYYYKLSDMFPPTFHENYARALWYARRNGLSSEDPEDCAMEFVRRILTDEVVVPTSLSPARLDAWLKRTTHNHVIDFLRAKNRIGRHEIYVGERMPESVSDTGDLPETFLLRAEVQERVRACLSRLCPYHKELLLRHHVEGESIRELAAFYKSTPNAIKQALYYARSRLKKMLLQEAGNEEEPW
jgi:RNA polymerase sigma factor (sigma-70 family)